MQDKLNFEISEAGTFTIINMSVAAVSSYLTGKFGDSHGHKNAMVIIFISYFCALVTCLFSTTLIHAYIIFVFLGIGMGGWITSAMSLIYEFSGQEDTKIYFALTDTLTAPFVLLSIIFTGVCIPIFGMDVVLMIIGFFMALGILSLMFLTKDPKTVQTKIESKPLI
jgi:MFS family permease